MRSRFGKEQWKVTDKGVTANLIKQYKPFLSLLKKQVPRSKGK